MARFPFCGFGDTTNNHSVNCSRCDGTGGAPTCPCRWCEGSGRVTLNDAEYIGYLERKTEENETRNRTNTDTGGRLENQEPPHRCKYLPKVKE